MSPELTEKLYHRFPLLYGSGLTWGFEHGDGWYEIIFNLSKKLEKLIEQIPSEDRGWYRASQCKEKYGSIRVYLCASTDSMDALIEEAEELSLKACEICSAPGKLYTNGWYKVRCNSCYAKGK